MRPMRSALRRLLAMALMLAAGGAAAAPPQRIVSLLPSITESVCALGACARLVGVDRYSNWPDAVKALPQLGGLDEHLGFCGCGRRLFALGGLLRAGLLRLRLGRGRGLLAHPVVLPNGAICSRTLPPAPIIA